MSLPASILSLLVLLGVLGLGYMSFVGDDSDKTEPINEAALDGTVDQAAQGGTPAGDDRAREHAGSADRRMDDFGPGPAGTVVTVPLKDRHRQAFSGKTAGAGGGSAADGQEETGSSETAAKQDPDPIPSESGGEEPGSEPSKVWIIEKAPETGNDPAVAAAAVPSFDVVRVDPLGNAVLAGRASPFAEVEVKAGDEVIDRVKATAAGEWVSTPIEPLGSGDQELSLSAAHGEGEPVVPSRQVVVVSIPEPAGQQNEGEAVAVLLDKEKGGEGRILQAPGTLKGEGRLALKLVDYDDEGAMMLSGEAPPGVPVRIYIDNEPAALVIGDAKGYWITTLDSDLPAGDYTLRLDQLDRKGTTVARLETPLTRVTTPPVEGKSKVDYVVVQPGNSLWRIARRLSGDGFNYVYIFEANQAQIRDPDVIYPGQVFEVPADTNIAG